MHWPRSHLAGRKSHQHAHLDFFGDFPDVIDLVCIGRHEMVRCDSSQYAKFGTLFKVPASGIGLVNRLGSIDRVPFAGEVAGPMS